MRRVGIYLRVSTSGQTIENQRRELEAVAARSGWQVVLPASAAPRAATSVPHSTACLKDATARRIDMIAAWPVDRLGRSLQDLVGFLGELQAFGCHLYL